MRVAIVNDMTTSARTLQFIVEREIGWNVIWLAKDGVEAVTKCRDDLPDIILMDLLMPVMNGVEATLRIMKDSPCTILIVTAGVEKNMPLVYEALGAGAIDATDMPGVDKESVNNLVVKLRTIGKILQHDLENKQIGMNKSASVADNKDLDNNEAGLLVAIGASTGGPAAVSELLGCLPSDFPAAIVIVQHVDQEYAYGMAGWLDSQTALPVRLAHEGDVPEAGNVLMAGTNDHIVFDKNSKLHYTEHPKDVVFRPSVNEFFASAALYWKKPIIGVLLTGMGRDGGRGLLALRRLGHYTIAQEKDSCAVYGMPRDAAERNAAVEVITPKQIGGRLIDLAKNNCRR